METKPQGHCETEHHTVFLSNRSYQKPHEQDSHCINWKVVVPKVMKTYPEIVRLHDQFSAILEGDAPEITAAFELLGGPEAITGLTAMASVLCWIMGHERGKKVAELSRVIDEIFKDAGYQMKDYGPEMQPR